MTTRILGIVAAVACSVSGTAEATTNLKPFEPVGLQGVVETTAKELLLPGAVVLLRTPQGDFSFGYGATELGGTISPRTDTHFRVASNTKTMTAAVIVLLVQEGKLRFDDPVSKYVEGVPNGDDITISDLLKMRSGLYNYTSAPELGESHERKRCALRHRHHPTNEYAQVQCRFGIREVTMSLLHQTVYQGSNEKAGRELLNGSDQGKATKQQSRRSWDHFSAYKERHANSAPKIRLATSVVVRQRPRHTYPHCAARTHV
jgi:CubicO group peptidase (beta-lactamase class C family)